MEEKKDINARMVGNAADVLKSLNHSMTKLISAANGASIKLLMPVGYLYCDYLCVEISVYNPIGWFKRLMLRWCFGLKYRAIEVED